MSEHHQKFEAMSMMERRPFENPAAQSFFGEWCRINDSIRPEILTREEWEEKSKSGLLQKRPDGKQDLLIPNDLQLWEMVEIMEAMDHDTFAGNPEKQKAKAEELRKLGGTFTNAGVYIAQRLDAIPQGKEIAHALAEEFFEYGQSLAGGQKPKEETDISDIALHLLNPKEIAEVDRFLAGESLYATRQARAERAAQKDPENKEKIIEAERKKTLAQFFRVAEKAFLLQGKSDRKQLSRYSENLKPEEHLKPWQSDTPIHSAFLRKVSRGMEMQIEKPHTELVGSVFRRGMDLLQKNMPFGELPNMPPGWREKIFYWKNGEKTLRDALGIDKLKEELEEVRQTGDIAAISKEERRIANRIHVAVSGFAYKSGANNPSEMIVTQSINCVGASTLGGAFLSEVGIKYLVGHVPKHSILVLVTSDGKIQWRDMLYPEFHEEITDDMIEGKSKTGAPLTVKDIVSYADNPLSGGLIFDIKGEEYKKRLKWVEEGGRQFLAVFPPEIGQKIQVLNNLGEILSVGGFKEEAVELYKQATVVDPKFAYPYEGLGLALSATGRKKEAIEAFRQSIAIDPEFAYPYYGLGRALSVIGNTKQAIEAYKKFVSLAEKQSLADNKDDNRIIKAKIQIDKLKRRILTEPSRHDTI